MRPKRYSVAGLLIVALFGSAGAGWANVSAQGHGAAIKLKAATFTPTRGEAPAIPPGLALAGSADSTP